MNKESPNCPTHVPSSYTTVNCPQKQIMNVLLIYLNLITLNAPNSSNLAGNKSTTNKCMCCDATSLLNLFNDSLPVWKMPEKGDWFSPKFTDTMDLPTTMLPLSIPRSGNTRDHHTLRRCSLLDLRIWLSSWRITDLTDLKYEFMS